MFHKSAKGRVVNFDEMVLKNAKTIAVGNANLNARGDVIGKNGKVVQTAEQRTASVQIETTTSKASVQSEISALKAARQNWAPSAGEQIEGFDNAEQPQPEESVKKTRKITESD